MDRERRLLVVAGLVWLSPARLLVHRRAHAARFGAGMLELPGGKIEPGESPERALARELVEEWGPAAAQLTIGPIARVLHHDYPAPGPEVVLLVYHVDGRAWPDDSWREHAHAAGGEQLAAYDVGALPIAEFLPADRDVVDAIARGEHSSPWR
ncbi:MAG: NUDIX domain-containing protein [Deltaproteobacteria bacterium]|nr:NUDIX domain-containing protein [Nannocystaceae bacterium]